MKTNAFRTLSLSAVVIVVAAGIDVIGAETNSVSSTMTNIQPIRIMQSADQDPACYPLPWQDRMDFDSYQSFAGRKTGRDFFSLCVYRTGPRTGLNWYVSADYPLSVVGPERDVMATGFSVMWKPRRW